MIRMRHVSLAVITAALAFSGAAFAQTQSAMPVAVGATGPEVDKAAINAPNVEPGYVVPRLKIGQPDLQGVWSNASNTTMRRPGAMKNLVMSETENQKARDTNPSNIRQRTDDNQKISDGLLDGKDLASGRGYNAFWIDPGTSYANVKGTWRTSWIVEPANGQVPTKAGVSGGGYGPRLGNGYDHPEERNLNERCIILGTSGPPIGNYLYNNNLRIVQSPNHVVIESEMIHDARIIPLNAEHRPKELAAWMGDSIGWWEGDTLVIETINMTRGGSTVQVSPSGKIIERFTRYNDKQVFYEFEVHDPQLYTQVWKGQMSLNHQPSMYEYACHEGNHGLLGILEGGRVADKQGRNISEDGDREE
jgi:hypothetical protein